VLERYQSEYLGVTLDTGNNLSILDDPMETVERLAPWTFNVHFRDMAIEETDEGFLLSEVPLGEGLLDMPRICAARGALLARDDHARSAARAVSLDRLRPRAPRAGRLTSYSTAAERVADPAEPSVSFR